MQPSANRISIGVVGCGAIGAKLHVPTLVEMQDTEILWVIDAEIEKAGRTARNYGIRCKGGPNAFPDMPRTDVVLLAIPYGARQPYYPILRDRGIAAYVEKPLARSASEHDRICCAFKASALCAGLQRRAWGPTRLLKRVLAERLFGAPRLVRYSFGRAGGVSSGGYLSNLALACGGQLAEVGIHGLDLVLFVTAAVSACVRSVQMQANAGFDLDTRADLEILTDTGETIECHIAISCLETLGYYVVVVCDYADLTLDLSTGEIVVGSHAGRGGCKLEPNDASPFPRTAYQTCAANWDMFLDGLRSETANWTAAIHCRLTTSVLEELYKRGGCPLPDGGMYL
jgi:predicted dehydrogenase